MPLHAPDDASHRCIAAVPAWILANPRLPHHGYSGLLCVLPVNEPVGTIGFMLPAGMPLLPLAAGAGAFILVLGTLITPGITPLSVAMIRLP